MIEEQKQLYIEKMEQFISNSCYDLGMPLLDGFLSNSRKTSLEVKILLLDFALDELSRRFLKVRNT